MKQSVFLFLSVTLLALAQTAFSRNDDANHRIQNTVSRTVPPVGKDKQSHADTIAKPLVILDGRQVNSDTIRTMDQGNIESMNVMKGDYAVKKYGVKGANGVIEILQKKDVIAKTTSALTDGLQNEADFFKKYVGVETGDKVTSYSLVKYAADEEVSRLDVNEGRLTTAARKFLNALQPGDRFSVERIVVQRRSVRTALPSRLHVL